ncbi:unnamed protein product [Schistosoma curassoni]|uniref:Ovule protein n=1 Tax=Schistosoma curassoni TaxID=6186 RepID=A0A183K5B2_9TREM|nr:unnamed protein product [Schistosoma curassoni]
MEYSIKTILQYWAETRRTTIAIIKKIQVFIQLSTQNTSDQLTRDYQQQDSSGRRNQEEALEVDRTHIEESIQLYHKAIPQMKPSKSKEKRKIKEHNTPRNGVRHQKNEQQLDRKPRTECGLENDGRRSMLH